MASRDRSYVHEPFETSQGHLAPALQFASNFSGPNTARECRSVQSIIIRLRAPKILKSLTENLRISGLILEAQREAVARYLNGGSKGDTNSAPGDPMRLTRSAPTYQNTQRKPQALGLPLAEPIETKRRLAAIFAADVEGIGLSTERQWTWRQHRTYIRLSASSMALAGVPVLRLRSRCPVDRA
jgi:hypothetical protein